MSGKKSNAKSGCKEWGRKARKAEAKTKRGAWKRRAIKEGN